ncbi:MAG: UvrB/UvrC motif-containing protein [Firmicutes bacterium]|nr:UvrB/UvrC motif-containing protein [Dethiobacter sp.]MBS3889154.1 UvrB/UvrC motif-containing protein [Bacillota bacterium]
MLCEECRERPATVHVTQVTNGDRSEKNLCEVCARAMGELDLMGVGPGSFSINNLLAGLMSLEQAAPTPKSRGMVCPTCGSDYRRFAEGGRFGCADCYQTFSRQIAPLLKRIHGNPVHQGKLPSRGAQAMVRKRQLHQLRDELKLMVDQEHFERAAELRDKIKKLEAE